MQGQVCTWASSGCSLSFTQYLNMYPLLNFLSWLFSNVLRHLHFCLCCVSWPKFCETLKMQSYVINSTGHLSTTDSLNTTGNILTYKLKGLLKHLKSRSSHDCCCWERRRATLPDLGPLSVSPNRSIVLPAFSWPQVVIFLLFDKLSFYLYPQTQ